MKTPASTRITGVVLLFAAMLFAVFPLLSMLSAALQPQGTIPNGLVWPSNPQWHNFVDAFTAANFGQLLGSSFIYVLGVVPASVIFAAMAGYAIAQLKMPGNKLLTAALLVGLTLPSEVIVIPLYYEIRSMGLLDSYFALILPLVGLNMPFGVFWMRTHFASIPAEISEAGSMDGAGPWTAFWRIHVPLAMSSLSALGLLFFLSTWNQFLLAIVLIHDSGKRTVSIALQNFISLHGTNEVLLNAGALLIMAPTIIIFLILQRQFVRALLQGSVKG